MRNTNGLPFSAFHKHEHADGSVQIATLDRIANKWQIDFYYSKPGAITGSHVNTVLYPTRAQAEEHLRVFAKRCLDADQV